MNEWNYAADDAEEHRKHLSICANVNHKTERRRWLQHMSEHTYYVDDAGVGIEEKGTVELQ